MTTNKRCPRWPHLAVALALTLLAACGGGGADGADTPTPTPATPTLTALGTSARTASLVWTPVPGASGYTLERRGAEGLWSAVATLGAHDDRYVDAGLAGNTTYTYRLAVQGVTVPPLEQAATTPADEPLRTAAPARLAGPPDEGTIGAAGGSVASAGEQLRVSLPAGAVAAATAVTLSRTTNPVPDGQGEGLQVRLAARPTQPLTLTMRYDAALDAQADALGLAIQRADGSWLTLPVTAIDKAQRTLTTAIAPGLLAADAPPALAQASAARTVATAAADVGIEFYVIRYLNAHLAPRASVVEAGKTQVLVPYARTLVTYGNICLPDEQLGCIPSPLLDQREIPIENQKAGYQRRWFVGDLEGGSPALGTITPRADSGAVYQAPAQEPTPNPVVVTFESKHLKSGRSLRLSAKVQVKEPIWTMRVAGTLEQSDDLGFSFSAEAVWTREAGSQTTYRATGTQSVAVINIVCTGRASPATVPLPPGALVIDRSVQPARYRLDVGSVWKTTITATCPDGQGSAPMDVPGQLIVEGVLSADGTRIDGTASLGGITWEWALSSQL